MIILGVQVILVLVLSKNGIASPQNGEGHTDEGQQTQEIGVTVVPSDGIHGDGVGSEAANEVDGRKPGCRELPSPGECRGAFPRYYYDEKSDQCSCFLWGGCVDDVQFEDPIPYNNWPTLEDCVESCVPGNKEMGPSCEQYNIKPRNYTTPDKLAEVGDTSHLTDEEFLNQLSSS